MQLLFAQEAREIVRRSEEHGRGKTLQASMTIQIVRPSYTREMELKTWSKGSRLSMVLVLAPARERGVVFLKQQREVWNWIPSIERNIKMPPSMMSQSWMGTDFTNDDLVKEASILEDYTHQLAGDTVVQGRPCFLIDLFPRKGAAVVWGRVRLSIDKKDYLMLAACYYDERGVLVNTLQCSDIKMLGGRTLPALMEMMPADKPGNKTVMRYRSLQFDQPMEDAFFQPANMNRVK